MAELIQMLAVLAGLYVLYALTLKKWNYTTDAQRKAHREKLKQKGMSNTFYFIHQRTLLILNLISGGLFTFFWIFRQWQAIRRGFKRLDGAPFKGAPIWRTIGGFFTFFSLNALMNRTCEYMHKIPTFPPFVWGTVWLGSLVGFFVATGGYKWLFYFIWCWVPSVLQNRLNALTPQQIPLRPQTAEICAAAVGTVLSVLIGLLLYRFKQGF